MLSIEQIKKAVQKATYKTVVEHDGVEHAGYMSFLTILSLFPFVVFFVSIAGFLGEQEQGRQLIELLFSYMPERFITALKPRIEEIVSGPPQGLFTLAVLATIWTASSMVEGTRTILNRAYHVSTPPAYIWRRLLSIAQFLLMTIATFIAMSFLVVVPVLWKAIEKILELPHDMLSSYWTYIRYGISIFVLAMVVAGSYHILPNIKQRFSAVLPGTFVVIVLWALFALGFAAYLQSFRQVNFIYGSLEGIIVALLFFYISSIIYIFGAELNYQIERALGHRVVQKEAVAAKDSKTPTPRQAREDERIEKQKESGSTKKPARKKKAPTKKQKKKS